MSVLTLGFTVESIAATTLALVRPLLGLGIVAALLIVFKPLLVGLLRAALLVIKPRRTFESRRSAAMLEGFLMMNRMARELDSSQPGLATELRAIAARA